MNFIVFDIFEYWHVNVETMNSDEKVKAQPSATWTIPSDIER